MNKFRMGGTVWKTEVKEKKTHVSDTIEVFVTIILGIILCALIRTDLSVQEFNENGQTENSSRVISRQRRALFMTSDRRLAFPPKTAAALDFVLSAPGLRPLPIGFGSESAVAIPVDINMDDLQLTSKENTWGEVPYVTEIQAYLTQLRDAAVPYLVGEQKPREIQERSLVFQVLEDTMHGFGINGTGCLLKFMCETHKYTLLGHGLFGEFVEMLLSVSGIPKARHHMQEYLKAELKGRTDGRCTEYEENCPLKIFGPLKPEESEKETFIRDKYYRKKKKAMEQRLKKKHYKRMKEERRPLRAHRNKRFIFFGPGGRLVLPFGSLFNTKAELKLPFMSNLAKGYKSGLNFGVAFRVIFDSLGLTSLINPFLALPGSDLIRKKRETWKPRPGVGPEGGDREVAYSVIAEFLDRYSINGNECILRAICETHSASSPNTNLISRSIRLFLSPSNSLHAEERLAEYVEAERIGLNQKSCTRYREKCSQSIYDNLN